MNLPSINQIIEAGWRVLNTLQDWKNYEIKNRFRNIVENLENKKPTPAEGLITFYDFYKSNIIVDNLTAPAVRDALLILLNIGLPKRHGCLYRFFKNVGDEIYVKSSLKEKTKRLDDTMDEIKNQPQLSLGKIENLTKVSVVPRV